MTRLDRPEGAIDLGHDVCYVKVVNTVDDQWVGVCEYHRNEDGDWCGGYAGFDLGDGHPQSTRWIVESFDPLTLSPSLLCRACNHHGWIRNGRWEPA